jgi:5,6-dimethylbenzimidazole synthase
VSTDTATLVDAFTTVVRRRRSTRAFDPDRDVDEATLLDLLDAGRWAPSGANAQPWEFLVVRDPTMRERIVELYLDQVGTKQRMEELVWKRKLTTGNVGFRHAPVLVLVLADPRVVRAFPVRTIREKGRDHLMSSMANATLLVHLAAAARGMASQWLSDASSPYMSTFLKDCLAIPDPIEIYDMIPLGWPAATPEPPPRRPLTEIVHRERYDPTLARDDEAVEEFLWTQTRLAAFGVRPDR